MNFIQPATIRIPQKLVALEVDGVEVSLPALLTDPYDLRLSPGEHTVVLEYYATVGTGSDRTVVPSEPFAVNVVTTPGSLYKMDYEGEENIVKSDLAAPAPRVSVTDLSGGVNVATQLAEVPAAPSAPTSGTTSAETSAQQDPIERLKFWWERASEADRAAFRTWLEFQN